MKKLFALILIATVAAWGFVPSVAYGESAIDTSVSSRPEFSETATAYTIMPVGDTELDLSYASIQISNSEIRSASSRGYYDKADVTFKYDVKNSTATDITQKFAVPSKGNSQIDVVRCGDTYVELKERISYIGEDYDLLKALEGLNRNEPSLKIEGVKCFTFLVSGVEAAQRMYVELPTDSSNLYAAIYSENKVAAITENSVGFGIDGDGNPTRYVTVAFFKTTDGNYGSASPKLICVSEVNPQNVEVREVGSYDMSIDDYAELFNSSVDNKEDWKNAFIDAIANKDGSLMENPQSERVCEWKEFSVTVPAGKTADIEVNGSAGVLRMYMGGYIHSLGFSVVGAKLWKSTMSAQCRVDTEYYLINSDVEWKKTDDGYEFDFDYKDRYVSFVLSSDKDPFGCDIDLTAILLLPLLILLPYVAGIIFLIVYFCGKRRKKAKATVSAGCGRQSDVTDETESGKGETSSSQSEDEN